MAIRIQRGMSPQYGRITMPQGTFLSNPSTAADGQLGGGSWGLPSQKEVLPRFGYGLQPQNPYAAAQAGYIPQLGPEPNPYNRGGVNPATAGYGTNPSMVHVNWGNLLGNATYNMQKLLGVDTAGSSINPVIQTNAGKIGQTTSPTVSTSGFSATPYTGPSGLQNGAVPAAQANILGGSDGLSPEQVAQKMVAAGYMLTNQPGVGEVWVPTARTQNATAAGAMAQNNRPEWVDGASLQPGESVTDANGNRYVGGTPAPDGTPQYAVNYANPSAANDTKGRYKWVSSVRKDQNGNWVRVNRQVLRKVYTRSHLKAAAARGSEAAQTPQANPAGEYNQLVNFRANFG